MLLPLKRELRAFKDPEKAKVLRGFFKTGKGEYGEGDKFLGVVVPKLRILSKRYRDLSLSDLEKIIQSKWHEERLLALLILVLQYQSASDLKSQKKCFQFYVKHHRYINSWDLVDLTAPFVIGHYLFDKEKSLLDKWVKSKSLWQRRVAILATFYFIRQNRFNETLKLAEALLNDNEDLIHKAVGWMLREVGKREMEVEEQFLKEHYHRMPRTMLRYAIERFPEKKRKAYLVLGVRE